LDCILFYPFQEYLLILSTKQLVHSSCILHESNTIIVYVQCHKVCYEIISRFLTLLPLRLHNIYDILTRANRIN